MPDFDRADQILAIARVLSRIPTGQKSRPYMGTPAPLLAPWATELYDDYGVRIHPDLAKKELVRVKSPAGNHGPVQAVSRNTPARAAAPNPEVQRMESAHAAMMEWLEAKDPKMAARVRQANEARERGDTTLAAIVLNDIRTEHPEVWEKGQEILANTPAERLG